MRKRNYFGKLVAIAMVFAGFSLSSCDKEDNAIINGQVWVKPEVQLVDGGAIITGSSPADINRMLGRVRQQIIQAAQKGESFTIDIQTSVLNASAGDNTINIAAVTGGNVVLNLPSNIVTNVPLNIQKQGVADNEAASASDNKMEINLPAGASNLNLNLNFPKTTVTLKSASAATIDELTAKTAVNTLVIENGITINWLKIKGGRAEVKTGGKVLGYMRDGSENEMKNEDVVIDSAGVQPVYMMYGPDVYYKKGDLEEAYYTEKLKIIKGDAKFAIVTVRNGKANSQFERILIEDGAAAAFNFVNDDKYDPDLGYWVLANECKGVKLIEGLGNKTAKIYSNDYWNNSYWNPKEEKYEDVKSASINLYYVNEIRNITVDATIVPDYYKWDGDQNKWVSEGNVEMEQSYISLPTKSTECDFIARESINGSVINNEMSKVTNCNLTVQKKKDYLSEQIRTINAINSKLTAEGIYEMSPNCEGSTFKGQSISFTNEYVSGNSATVKNCKFETSDKEPYARVEFPYQTKDRSEFNFGFDTCDFAKGFKFSTSYQGWKPWLDKDGKLITKAYFWHELNEDGTIKTDDWGNRIEKRSANESDIPAANKANGKFDDYDHYVDGEGWVLSNGYWIRENSNGFTEDAYFKDFKGYLTLKNTTLDGKAITSKTDMIGAVNQGRDEKGEQATKTYYVIDGTTYEALYSSNDKKWILVSVE